MTSLSRLRAWVLSETGERLTSAELWQAVRCIEAFAFATGTVPEFRKQEK